MILAGSPHKISNSSVIQQVLSMGKETLIDPSEPINSNPSSVVRCSRISSPMPIRSAASCAAPSTSIFCLPNRSSGARSTTTVVGRPHHHCDRIVIVIFTFETKKAPGLGNTSVFSCFFFLAPPISHFLASSLSISADVVFITSSSMSTPTLFSASSTTLRWSFLRGISLSFSTFFSLSLLQSEKDFYHVLVLAILIAGFVLFGLCLICDRFDRYDPRREKKNRSFLVIALFDDSIDSSMLR